MADYPNSIYSPREKENRAGVVYDPAKKTVIFVEDIKALDDEVVAIEKLVGKNVDGQTIPVAGGFLKGKADGQSKWSTEIFVDDNGNVGIGTTGPTQLLHVTKANQALIEVQSTDSGASDTGFTLVTPDRTWNFGQNIGGIGAGKFNFYDVTAGASRVVIDTSGNVGIGTTGPTAKLHTIGNVRIDRISDASTGRLFINGGGLGYSSLNISPTGDRAQIFLGNNVDANGNKFIRVSGGNLEVVDHAYSVVLFVITDNGNVGIGTTGPSAKLDVNSDILRLRTAKTPASSGAAGNPGDICWDADYIYVCVATNSWKRVAIATW